VRHNNDPSELGGRLVFEEITKHKTHGVCMGIGKPNVRLVEQDSPTP
jgi:hypothetical protein